MRVTLLRFTSTDEAMKVLLDLDATMQALVLVDTGPDQVVVEAACRDVYGLCFRPLGHGSDVSEILQACDIFVFPTLHENLSNALLEDIAVSLPIVASAVGGNVEVLGSGGGILFPISSIACLLADPLLRTAHGEQARNIVQTRYTTTHMVAELDRMYTSIFQDGF